MKRVIILFCILFGIFTFYGLNGIETMAPSPIPVPLEDYKDGEIESISEVLKHRISYAPFNLVCTIVFLCSIVHIFFASKITEIGHRLQKKQEKKSISATNSEQEIVYKAEILHFLGEIEAVFAIWVIPLIFAIIYFYGWHGVTSYIDTMVNYQEAIFVVVIMTIASTRPIIKLSEKLLKTVANFGKCSPGAWWFSILTIGPLLGSVITEPAAMTISALLLAKQFYDFKPNARLCYATIGLLFVNISVGGTLTHFAAPPVLMIASTWGWTTPFMLANFGWKVILGILTINTIYYMYFRKDFQRLRNEAKLVEKRLEVNMGGMPAQRESSIPIIVTLIHICFLAWTVFTLHYSPLVIGGFLFFLAFTQVTLKHQYALKLRMPLLVGLFLAGLVTHGTLQQWWIQPVLGSLSEVALFMSATFLTSFNDNAAITFLASLVPEFAGNLALQKAVVMGAVAGGGLTVIANAPNPAGQSILSKYFEFGINPLLLFLGALVPTIVMSCFLMFLF